MIVLIHAHGENIDKLEKYVPRFKRFIAIAITQARTSCKVYNFGGTLQGDRFVFYTMEFPKKTFKLAGIDFEDSRVNTVKKKRLKWTR